MGSCLFQKIVKRIINKLELRVNLASLPEEFLQQNVVFFLRSSKGNFKLCVCVCGGGGRGAFMGTVCLFVCLFCVGIWGCFETGFKIGIEP